jgi:hypothetical protein
MAGTMSWAKYETRTLTAGTFETVTGCSIVNNKVNRQAMAIYPKVKDVIIDMNERKRTNLLTERLQPAEQALMVEPMFLEFCRREQIGI